MTVEPYPAYKASGVEWLGSIPETWSVERIRRRARLRTDKAVDASLKVALENVESWTGRFIDTEDADYSGEGIAFARGDVLFGKLRPYLAKAWRADSEGAAIGDFHVYSLGSDTNPRFFQYMILSGDFISLVDGSTYGAKMPRASWDFIGNLLEVFPPLDEQRQIADYLDIHTAKIDTLIGKQEQLIETLAERRQALISHAVTKGLDPNVPMKDSGIEWMGSIPSSWTVSRLRYMARIFGGYSPEQVMPRESGPYPYFKVSDLNQADGDYSVAAAAEYTDQQALTVPTGTILFPKRGAAIFTNKVTVSTIRAVLDTNLMGLFVNDLIVNPLFLIHWLKSRTLNELADTSTLPQINNKHIYPLQIGLPSLKGQREITEYIDRETTQIDALSAKAREMIDVLKERRQALISAAVTGKIDVRGLA